MENSVDSYINAQPEEAMTFNEFWNSIHGESNPYSPGMKFVNFFTGWEKKARDSYETYLSNLKNRNEFLAQQSARAWDKMMDDSKYQRTMKDLEAAGLNPYLLVNNGGLTASSAPTSAKASYDVNQKSTKNDSKTKSNMAGLAVALLALIKMAAAL